MRWTSWLTDRRRSRRANDIVLGPDRSMAFRLPHASPQRRSGGNGIRGVTHQRAVEALAEAGFRVLSTGAHTVMTNGKRIVTIPCQDPVNGLTMEGIVRDSGLSVEQFRGLL
jgi:hypothetical protein